MARFRRPQRQGPGLLFVLVALVVVAAAGARFLGLTPGAPFQPSSTTEIVREEIPAPAAAPEEAKKGKILLYHAHSTENYSPKPSHAKKGLGDIAVVAQSLRDELQSKGYEVTYLQEAFDVPDFSGAFENAAVTLSQHLQREEVVGVIDIHRDGLPKSKGDGYTTVNLAGEATAKLLFVVGDVSNPNKKRNLALAQSLKDYLDHNYPGLVRGIKVQHRNLNGSLHPNTLTVYIGDYHDNTLSEATAAVAPLAEAIDAVLGSQAEATMAPIVTP